MAYSAGMQFNPTEELAIDVSFEGSSVNNWKTRGINAGIGYRF
ncbi:Ail/Lom family outer membrane beta-barrel protein [Escherichia coli]